MDDLSPTNRIYLTYKARIIAEAKLRRYARLLNAVIVWYSFLMIIASFAVSNDAISISFYEIIFASASIAIFAASVFLATGMLEKRAADFRACYLELQKIYTSVQSEKAKMSRYHDALDRYPNHASRDHADLIFATWRSGGHLCDTSGPIKFTPTILIPTAIRKLSFWFIVGVVFTAPIWIAPIVVNIS